MTRPLRARYGARDNMHALLDCEGDPVRVPADLLGLTDKPPGSYAPGDRWWPSVGCGPVEGWWALWWTQPDERASRAGMVRSEVALWRLEDVGAVDDLRPILESLGRQGPISLPSTDLLGAVAEALLSTEPGRPILRDLDLWPGMIAALWARLWPEARRAFSARVAVSPPQGGESVAPPWLFGVPPERALLWSEHRVITAAPGPNKLSRAARWLLGEKDPTFDDVLVACPALPAELVGLTRVARAADRLERLREDPEPQRALNLLRTLLLLAPDPDTAATLKREGLGALERGLGDASSTLVLSLANLDVAKLPAEGTLERALTAWTSRWAAGLPIEEASRLLEMLSPGKAEIWWQRAVQTSLSVELVKPEPRWARAALHWLLLVNAAEVLRDLLPATEGIEQHLLDVTSGLELAEADLQQLRRQAAARGWSRLHAWAVMQALSPREALSAQRAFPRDPSAGVALLVERLPGPAVVEEAILKPDTRLTELVARRTAREPALLATLDAGSPAWRALWAAHVKAGGPCWPSGVDRHALGHGLLDAVLARDEPDGLIVAAAEGMADTALDHPRRAALWDALSMAGRDALLPRAAEALVRRCDAGDVIPTPERQLGEAVVSWVRRTRPSARVFAMLLTWDVQLDEYEAIRWLQGSTRSEWTPVADAVGRAVLVRQWKRLAMEIYHRCQQMNELRPALEACQELLPGWERWVLSWRGMLGSSSDLDDGPLVNRVAELGANLAPERLDDLWVRAGGESKRLPSSGSPDVRWRHAAALARKGALKGGLVALVRELQADWPYNPDLQALEPMLNQRR